MNGLKTYDNAKKKDRTAPIIRNKNIKSLLLSFYSLFPPLRNEGLNLKIVDSHEEAKNYDYSVYIKDEKITFGFN